MMRTRDLSKPSDRQITVASTNAQLASIQRPVPLLTSSLLFTPPRPHQLSLSLSLSLSPVPTPPVSSARAVSSTTPPSPRPVRLQIAAIQSATTSAAIQSARSAPRVPTTAATIARKGRRRERLRPNAVTRLSKRSAYMGEAEVGIAPWARGFGGWRGLGAQVWDSDNHPRKRRGAGREELL